VGAGGATVSVSRAAASGSTVSVGYAPTGAAVGAAMGDIDSAG